MEEDYHDSGCCCEVTKMVVIMESGEINRGVRVRARGKGIMERVQDRRKKKKKKKGRRESERHS